jgi:hypothetical protein
MVNELEPWPRRLASRRAVPPRRNQVGDVSVPEVMKAQARQSTPSHPTVKDLGNRLRVNGCAVGLSEDKAVVGVAGADGQLLGRLTRLVSLEDGHRPRVAVDSGTAVVGLRAIAEITSPLSARSCWRTSSWPLSRSTSAHRSPQTSYLTVSWACLSGGHW